MMKSTGILIAFILLNLNTRAQFLSLNNKETGRLKKLISAHTEVQNLFAKYQRLADRALDTVPNPIVLISSEGRLKGDPVKTATQASIRDFRKIYAMALVYKINGDKKYLQKTTAYLVAWAKINHSKGDPIDDTNLDDMLEGYDLIKKEISPDDNELIVNWLRGIAEAEIGSIPKNQNRESAFNNWNSHRIKVIGEIGYAINNPDLQQFALTSLKKQLEKNLLPDGSSIDFKLRDALHYHAYDLEPLLKLAILLKRATGTDYYTYKTEKQTSLKKSTAWFLPYLTGEKVHPEFVGSTVKFDLERAKNGEAGYKAGTLFDPANGLRTLELAAYFDTKYLDAIKAIQKTTLTYTDWQLVMNKVMK